MNKVLNAIKNSLLALFGKGPLASDYEKVIEMVPKALVAVSWVAGMTPNKTDDQIVSIIHGMMDVAKQNVAPTNAKDLMRYTAGTILKGQLDGEQPGDRIINAAIELAYIAYRQGKRS